MLSTPPPEVCQCQVTHFRQFQFYLRRVQVDGSGWVQLSPDVTTGLFPLLLLWPCTLVHSPGEAQFISNAPKLREEPEAEQRNSSVFRFPLRVTFFSPHGDTAVSVSVSGAMDYSRVIFSLVRCAPWSSVLLLIQMVELTAAKALPALSCDVSAQADGTFLHMLSASFGLECSPGWEDINRTAITQVSEVAGSLVQNLTVRSLTLRRCLDFTRFTATCPDGVWTEAVCRFDCSSALSAVDSVTRFCVSGTCLVVVVLPVVAAVVLLAGFLIYKKIQQKHKRREKSAALEEEEGGLELLSKD